MRFVRMCLFATLSVVLATPASAQNVSDGGDSAAFHFGPVGVTPRVGLRNLGLDTNVFNLPDAHTRDTTATLVAGADSWLRVGRAHFAGKTSVDWLYFRTAVAERSVNLSQEARVDFDLLRLVPTIGGAFLNSRQRPNDEIDVRIQQQNVSEYAGVLVPLGAHSRVDLELKQQSFDYSIGRHGNELIASALNRKSTTAAIKAGVDLTPLTRIIVEGDTRADRFEFSPDRDSNSLRVMPGFEFQPTALISGKALVGYRRFRTPSAAVADVAGLVSAVELKYVVADTFKASGEINRDVEYSIDPNDSIYVSTSAGVEIVQAVGLNWDVLGRLRHAVLAYQTVAPDPQRIDRLWTSGAGIGRRIAGLIRVGFDLDYVTRTSPRRDRTFDGFRYGASVTYGY